MRSMFRVFPLVPLLGLAVSASARPSDGLGAAFQAYSDGQYARCSSVLLALDATKGGIPLGGELLTAECLADDGRIDAAMAFIERKLPDGQIDLDDLQHKDRPGLNKIRTSKGWPALLAKAQQLQQARVAQYDQPLRQELLACGEKDQQARKAVTAAGNTPEAWKQVEPIDHDNTAWLKQVVATKGWPDASRVGSDAAKAAWEIVQHADADPQFQAQVLPLMQAAVERHQASGADFAMLTDRVLRAQGKPQRYGSQFKNNPDGSFSMEPVEDEAGLDQRRASVGLQPIAEYRNMLAEMYHVTVH